MTVIHLSTGHVFVRESVVAITPLEEPRACVRGAFTVSFHVVGIGFSVPIAISVRRNSDDPDWDDFVGPVEPFDRYHARLSCVGAAVRQEFVDRLLFNRPPAGPAGHN